MLEITVCDIWIDLPCIYYLVLCTLTVIHWTSEGGAASVTVSLAADSLGPVGCTVAPKSTCSIFQILSGIEIVRLSDRDGS